MASLIENEMNMEPLEFPLFSASTTLDDKSFYDLNSLYPSALNLVSLSPDTFSYQQDSRTNSLKPSYTGTVSQFESNLPSNGCSIFPPSQAQSVLRENTIWNSMANLPTNSTNIFDRERTFYGQFLSTGTYFGRFSFDVGLTNENQSLMQLGSNTRVVSGLFSQALDLSTDYRYYRMLETQCGLISPEKCAHERWYVLTDGVMTSSALANNLLTYASDKSIVSDPILSDRLIYATLPFAIISLFSGVVSSLSVLFYEFQQKKESRDDIRINRAFQTLSGTATALLNKFYQFGLIGFDAVGANLLTPRQRADLIRGRLIKVNENTNFGYYKTVGQTLGLLSAAVVMYLAWQNYGETLQKAYKQNDDLTFNFNLLGLTATLAKGLASSALNVPGLVPHACALYILGCSISVYQILYQQNGGEDKYSTAYARTERITENLLTALQTQRQSCGVSARPLEAETNLESWRSLLIVAGIDGADRSSSILDRASLEVPTRAADVYNVAQQIKQGEASEKWALLLRIVREANLSEDYAFPKEAPRNFSQRLNYSLIHQNDIYGPGAMRTDLNLEGPFLTNDTLAQAAYLVFLEQSGVLTEEYWGTELWNNSPALRLIRLRLQKSDAQFLRENVFGYNSQVTPLLLVYLKGRSPEDRTLWENNSSEIQEVIKGMDYELSLSGIGSQLDTIQKQMQYYWSHTENTSVAEPSEEQINQLIEKIYADASQIKTPTGGLAQVGDY